MASLFVGGRARRRLGNRREPNIREAAYPDRRTQSRRVDFKAARGLLRCLAPVYAPVKFFDNSFGDFANPSPKIALTDALTPVSVFRHAICTSNNNKGHKPVCFLAWQHTRYKLLFLWRPLCSAARRRPNPQTPFPLREPQYLRPRCPHRTRNRKIRASKRLNRCPGSTKRPPSGLPVLPTTLTAPSLHPIDRAPESCSSR